MTREERLHRLFGNVDDDLVADAARRPLSRMVWVPVSVAAAAVALTVGLALTQPWAKHPLPVAGDDSSAAQQTTAQSDNTTTQTTTVRQSCYTENGLATSTRPVGGTPTTTTTAVGDVPPEVWYEQKWDDKPVWQQFPQFDRNQQQYTLRDVTVPADKIGDYLGDVTLHGYDVYTDTAYTRSGKLYRIRGISDACAVALQYAGRTDYFPATNSQYAPATLEQLIADLSLREHLRVGTVYHSYRDEEGTLHDVHYNGLTVEKVWELLMENTALPNEYDWQHQWQEKIAVSIDMPLLGYTNVSLSLSKDGYMRTNLLDTEKTFFIGADTVAAFMDYVQTHCRMYETLTALPDGTPPSNGTTTSQPAQPLTTMTTHNP